MANKVIATVLNLKDNFSETIKKTTDNTNKFTKEVSNSKSIIGSFAGGAASSFKSIAGSVLGLAGTYVGVKAVFGYVKDGIEMAKNSEAGLAQLGAVITSTNDACGMSKDALLDLAGSYGTYTTYTKGAVLSGENLLLTFTGLGKDVLPDVTTTMLDMSTALKQDVTASAMTLGKALNDPTTGLAKLTKQGVTFTEAQQTQVKAMVKAGDTVGAQKVMLQELQKEFGGSAKAAGETLPGQIAIMQNAFNGIQKSIGEKFIPVLYNVYSFAVAQMPTIKAVFTSVFNEVGNVVTAAVDIFTNYLLPVLTDLWTTAQPTLLNLKDGATEAFGKIKVVAGDVFNGIKKFVDDNKVAFLGFMDSVIKLGTTIGTSLEPTIMKIVNTVLPALQSAFDNNKGTITAVLNAATDTFNFISDNWNTIVPIVEGITLAVAAWKIGLIATEGWAIAVTTATAAWEGITILMQAIQGWTDVWAIAQWALNAAMDANPIGIVIIAIAALGTAIYEVVTHFKDICEWIEKAWNWLTVWNDTDAKDKNVNMNETHVVTNEDGSTPLGALVDSGANATGTQYWKGGLTKVGEHGPELVNLPGGSKVSTASETQKTLGGNGVNVHVTIQGNVIGNEEYANAIGQHIWDKINLNLINT